MHGVSGQLHLKDEIDSCFSIVSKSRVINLKAYQKETAEFWVHALRLLLGHDKALSDKLSKEGLESGGVDTIYNNNMNGV